MFSSFSFTFHNEQIRSYALFGGLGSPCGLLSKQIVKRHRNAKHRHHGSHTEPWQDVNWARQEGARGDFHYICARLPNLPQRLDPKGSCQPRCPGEIWSLWGVQGLEEVLGRCQERAGCGCGLQTWSSCHRCQWHCFSCILVLYTAQGNPGTLRPRSWAPSPCFLHFFTQ